MASNWGGTAPSPADDLVFNATANANTLNNDYAAGTAFHSLTFSGATTYSPGGNTILLGAGGVTQSGSAVWNDFIPINLSASQIWTFSGPSNVMNGPAALDLGTNGLTIQGSGNMTFANTITGSGSLLIKGPTTLSGTLNNTSTSVLGAHLVLSSLSTVNSHIVINAAGFLDIPPANSILTAATLNVNNLGTFDLVVNGSAVGQFSRLTSNAGINLVGNLALTNTVIHPAGTVISFLNTQLGGHDQRHIRRPT